jgi:hypothetical protein
MDWRRWVRRHFTDAHHCKELFIPHAVKTIKDGAFRNCAELRTAKLGEGLEEIGYWSFGWCTKLRRLAITPAVKEIDERMLKPNKGGILQQNRRICVL